MSKKQKLDSDSPWVLPGHLAVVAMVVWHDETEAETDEAVAVTVAVTVIATVTVVSICAADGQVCGPFQHDAQQLLPCAVHDQ